MSCSKTENNLKRWNNVFSTRKWSSYPVEDLIRFMARKYGSLNDRSGITVLELGCGPGANIWYLAREGYKTSGIDGSAVAISLARTRLEEEGMNDIDKRIDLRQGNFAILPYVEEEFDVVIDIEAIYANTMNVISSTIKEVHRVLKPDGTFFGKMFGTETNGFKTGVCLEENTMVDPSIGNLAGFGIAHFFEEAELVELFKDFSKVTIDWTSRSEDGQKNKIFEWLVIAEK